MRVKKHRGCVVGVFSKEYVCDKMWANGVSSEQSASNDVRSRVKLCGSGSEWRKWCSCRAFQKVRRYIPVGLESSVRVGHLPPLINLIAQSLPVSLRDVSSTTSIPGSNFGLPKIGNRGEVVDVRDVWKVIWWLFLRVVPIRGWVFRVLGRSPTHHSGPSHSVFDF